jgi:hypothetical protein
MIVSTQHAGDNEHGDDDDNNNDNNNNNNNRCDWNHLKITQTVPDQHTGKARSQGTAKNGHIGHCTLHTAGSADVKVQNILHGRNNITCSTDVNTEQLQHCMP